ncbi:geranylgeranyl pyrophosphate synthetase [Peltigera leucophlebia]|nr:geranylgeranyl pyrophosphate synthetase [Peltigera leucophlebia]
MDDSAIEARARSLIDAHSPDVKSCIRQPTIYDTAWVAMLSRSIDDGSPEWVFPDSFQFLLDHQKLNGGWATSESKLDNILNTLAATLALKRHYGSSLKANQIHAAASLGSRVSKAERFLQREMSDWEPELSSHTGFEILIPALLSMLEDEGITLHFAGRQRLMKLKQEFFAKFDLQNLYKSENSSILYFLEAFLGLGDFERLGLHKARGSIMRSPSSTAAYLIGLRLWDTDCEACIRTAIQATGVPGGVPSVFPPKPVEFATIWATLLNSDLVTDYRGKYESASVMSTVEVGTDMAMTYNGFGNYQRKNIF